MRIEIAKKKDVIQFVKIHKEAFDGFFLTSLGDKFLYNYYRCAIKRKDCIAIKAINEKDEIIGFALGTTLSKGFHKRLFISNFFSFFLEIIRIAFSNIKAILRLIKNTNKIQNINDDGIYAELLSIGVLNSCKSKGVGKNLLNKFELYAKNKNCYRIALTTDFYNNEKVLSFYKNKGYNEFYILTAYPNRKMYKLIKNIK